MSDYPLGAKYDPRAPYNQVKPELVRKRVLVSAVLSKTIELEVPENFERTDLIEKFEESPEYLELCSMWDKGWIDDDLEIMEDF